MNIDLSINVEFLVRTFLDLPPKPLPPKAITSKSIPKKPVMDPRDELLKFLSSLFL